MPAEILRRTWDKSKNDVPRRHLPHVRTASTIKILHTLQARSSVRLERFLDTEEVDGSSPFGPTISSHQLAKSPRKTELRRHSRTKLKIVSITSAFLPADRTSGPQDDLSSFMRRASKHLVC